MINTFVAIYVDGYQPYKWHEDITIGKEFEIKLKISPTIYSALERILTLRKKDNTGRSRPVIQFYFLSGTASERRIVFTNQDDVYGNGIDEIKYHLTSDPHIPINAWTELSMKQYESQGKYWYEISVNGSIIHKAENPQPVVRTGLTLNRGGAGQGSAMKGYIKDVTIRKGEFLSSSLFSFY